MPVRVFALLVLTVLFTALPVYAATSITLENAGSATLPSGIVTFGQVFSVSEVPQGSSLVAEIGRQTVPAQLDVKTTWPDGSAKMAVVAIARPVILAGRSVPFELVPSSPASDNTTVLSLLDGVAGQNLVVDLIQSGKPTTTINVFDQLRTAHASGRLSYWQRGPLVTEGRVDVLINNSSLRLIFDVAVYKGGGFVVKAQYANDRVLESNASRLNYTARVRLNDVTIDRQTVEHELYRVWHATYASTEKHGTQGLGSPRLGWLNIRHDVATLVDQHVVPSVDLSLSISEATLSRYTTLMGDAAWGRPLTGLGVLETQQGYRTWGKTLSGAINPHSATWLITQDPRAAAYSMGLARAAGAVPSRLWDTEKGTWVNRANHPTLSAQIFGSPVYLTSDSTRIPKHVVHANLRLDLQKLPETAFIPYLLTGERWALDNVLSQASWASLALTTGINSYFPNAQRDTVNLAPLVGASVVLRELDQAAWIVPDATSEASYFRNLSAKNWRWLARDVVPWLAASQGEAYGHLTFPGPGGGNNTIVMDDQHQFSQVASVAGLRGSAEAKIVAEWMKHFVLGYYQPSSMVTPLTSKQHTFPIEVKASTTWAGMHAQTRDYDSVAKYWTSPLYELGKNLFGALAGFSHLTNDPAVARLYEELLTQKPPRTNEADYVLLPNYTVLTPGIYSDTFRLAKAPTVSLLVSPTIIERGGRATLRWSSSNARSCSASWLPSKNTKGEFITTPNQTTTFNISCVGASGTATSSVELVVVDPKIVTDELSSDRSRITPASTEVLRTSDGIWTFDVRSGASGHLVKLNGKVSRGVAAVELTLAGNGKLFARTARGVWFIYEGGTWRRTTDPALLPSLPSSPVEPEAESGGSYDSSGNESFDGGGGEPGGEVQGVSDSNSFKERLSLGSTGEVVRLLQSLLQDLGFYQGEITGYFGPLTEVAVKNYQTSRGLEPVGVVGPQTRAFLNRER